PAVRWRGDVGQQTSSFVSRSNVGNLGIQPGECLRGDLRLLTRRYRRIGLGAGNQWLFHDRWLGSQRITRVPVSFQRLIRLLSQFIDITSKLLKISVEDIVFRNVQASKSRFVLRLRHF